jgi:diaminopimelate decarboxylase
MSPRLPLPRRRADDGDRPEPQGSTETPAEPESTAETPAEPESTAETPAEPEPPATAPEPSAEAESSTRPATEPEPSAAPEPVEPEPAPTVEAAHMGPLSPSARAALEQLANLAASPADLAPPAAEGEPAAPTPPALPIDTLYHDGLLAGVSPFTLATDFGTPTYVYDLDLVGRRIDALGEVLPFGFRLAFAVKANPALGLLAHVAGTGIGADIASGGELETVLRAGFAPVAVAMTGPGKRDEELAAAVTAGIGAVTVESPGELARLDGIAARLRRRQAVMLRLAVGGDARHERVRLIGGADGKFGMPLPVLKTAARLATSSPNLELLGVHAFGASNLLDADRIANHVAELVAVAREVAAEVGVPLRLVDAGGGLGIPYSDADQPLDLALLGRRLEELRGQWDADPALREMEVLIEPGRFLVGPAGAYMARVIDVKGTPDAPVAILDGGINHLVRTALVRQEQRLVVLGPGVDARPRVPTLVAGPLCTGLDVFTVKASLPRPHLGDLVAVLDAGAYGFTEAMPFFLSHPTAAEVAVRGGQARLIRPRIAPQEVLERQISPRW